MSFESNTFFALAMAVIIVGALMHLYKSCYYLATKKATNKVANQIIAWILSYVAVVLCWWGLGVPEHLHQTFVYVFLVYVLQMTFDLRVINKIVKCNGEAKFQINLDEDDKTKSN